MIKHYSWSAIDKFGSQFINLISNILIARLLTPNDYGLIAMLAIFIGIAWNFTESGFADWLIKEKNATKKDFSIIFVHNISFAILFYFALYISAPYIAYFFQKEELISITRILSLSLIFKASTITEYTRMKKELQFKKTAIINITSAIIAFSIAYTLALSGYGYWALVGQVVITSIIQLVLIIFINKWKPYFYFNWRRYKKMRVFGNNMLISYFTNQIGVNLYSIFIGKFYSLATLGYFNQGNKLRKVGFQGLNAVILTTSYPLLAREENLEQRKKMYVNILNFFFFLHFIISFFIIGATDEIILTVFGEKWSETAPILKLMLISFLFRPFLPLNANIIKIENKTQLYRNLTFLKNGLVLLSLLMTFKISLNAILYGQIIANFLTAFIFILYSGKYINLHLTDQIILASKQLFIPFTAMIFGVIFLNFSSFSLLVSLTIYTLIYGITLIIGFSIFSNSQFYTVLNKLKLRNKNA